MADPQGVPDGWVVVSGHGVDPAPASGVVSASEPGTYAAGAMKGLKEGVVGGAKGFVEGLTDAPGALVRGAYGLVTDPVGTAKGTVEAIGRLPEAVRRAGRDPEGWGRDVGTLTGQTMLMEAAPKIPAMAKPIARGAVKVATIADKGIIPDVVGMIHPVAAHALRVTGRVARVVNSLMERAAAKTPPLAEIVTEIQKTPEEVMPVAHDQPVVEPVTAGDQHPATNTEPVKGKSPQQTLNEEAIARRRAEYQAKQQPVALSQAVTAVNKAAAGAEVKLSATEFAEATRLAKAGHAPADVLDAIQVQRALKDTSAFDKLPTDAEMKADMGTRARKGQKSLMPTYGDEPPPKGNPYR